MSGIWGSHQQEIKWLNTHTEQSFKNDHFLLNKYNIPEKRKAWCAYWLLWAGVFITGGTYSAGAAV